MTLSNPGTGFGGKSQIEKGQKESETSTSSNHDPPHRQPETLHCGHRATTRRATGITQRKAKPRGRRAVPTFGRARSRGH